MTCETLPIWRPDESSPSLATDCSKDLAARKIYEEVSNSVVQVNIGSIVRRGSASGFLVGDDDEVLTNSHVAAQAGKEWLHITTVDNKEYTAIIEAADEANDLALLKVLGLPSGTYKPLPFRPSASVQPGEEMFVLGHPGGRAEVYISPGQMLKRGPLRSLLLDQPDHGAFDAPPNLLNVDKRTQARYSPRIGSSAIAQGGNSGGPVVDSHGFAIGVLANVPPPPVSSRSLFVPSELAMSLMNPGNRTRRFEYQVEMSLLARPNDALPRQLSLIGDPLWNIGDP